MFKQKINKLNKQKLTKIVNQAEKDKDDKLRTVNKQQIWKIKEIFLYLLLILVVIAWIGFKFF